MRSTQNLAYVADNAAAEDQRLYNAGVELALQDLANGRIDRDTYTDRVFTLRDFYGKQVAGANTV